MADDGANSWEHRREATLRMLEREAPTVFGIQEGYLFQVKYIEENLPQYGRVGVGRDDGKEGGEIMAVFYLRDRYDLLDHGDLWGGGSSHHVAERDSRPRVARLGRRL